MTKAPPALTFTSGLAVLLRMEESHHGVSK